MSELTAPQQHTKQPGETIKYTMDFSAWLASTDTITDPVVTSELRSGCSSSDLTISSVAVSGQTVTMLISGGVAGKVYRIEVTVTSGVQTLEGDGILKISTKQVIYGLLARQYDSNVKSSY